MARQTRRSLANRRTPPAPRDLLPLLNSKKVELLDHHRLIAQLTRLQRRTGRNRDHIDHAPNEHDDVANCVAGVLASNFSTPQALWMGCFGYGGPVTEIDPRTGRPIKSEATIRWVRVTKLEVGAAKGP